MVLNQIFKQPEDQETKVSLDVLLSLCKGAARKLAQEASAQNSDLTETDFFLENDAGACVTYKAIILTMLKNSDVNVGNLYQQLEKRHGSINERMLVKAVEGLMNGTGLSSYRSKVDLYV